MFHQRFVQPPVPPPVPRRKMIDLNGNLPVPATAKDLPACAVVVGHRRLSPIEVVTYSLALVASILFLFDMLVLQPRQTAIEQATPATRLAALAASDDPREAGLVDDEAESALCKGPRFDAVLVLGGGQVQRYNRPNLATRRRCDIAGRLYQCRLKAANGTHHGSADSDASPPAAQPPDEFILALSAGSAHAGLHMDDTGFPILCVVLSFSSSIDVLPSFLHSWL